MKIATTALLALAALQDRVSPDLLDYQPVSGVKGTLELGPATGFENVLTLWSERMKEHYPDLRGGKVEASTLSVPRALKSGASRFGMLPRRWTDAELEDYQLHWGFIPTELVVGGDAIVIVVHAENPIRSLLPEKLDALFSSTRRRGGKPVKTWGDLGLDGDWKAQPVNLYGCGKDSPLRTQFRDRVLQGGLFLESVKEVAGAKAVLASVAEDPCGIGYVNGGLRAEGTRVVPLRPSANEPAVEPQAEAILSLTYPFSWRICISLRKIPRTSLDPVMVEFLKMVLSRDGQTILAGEGMVPVTGRFARKELLKVK